jgi:AcrR family transcriptional regulator
MTAGAGQVGTRERLQDAAIRLFARQGYAETSIADIQRDCGLSAGSGALYKHFSSKRELLEAATRRLRTVSPTTGNGSTRTRATARNRCCGGPRR